MRVDGVEIKVTVADGQVARALDVLELGRATRLTIWFYEDVSVGMRLPLLEAGLVLRARAETSDADGDLTVKLRPCRASQLAGDWLTLRPSDELDFRVEEDWAGPRRVLAASAQADLPAGLVPGLRTGPLPLADLLTADQRRYLAECAGLPVNPDGLAGLGPVAATKWKSVEAPGLGGLDARAERWVVEGLDFLELSVKTGRAEAEDRQHELETALGALGLGPDPHQETKTRRVLEALAGSPARAPQPD